MQTDNSLPGILIVERDKNGLIAICQATGNLPTTAGKFAVGCLLVHTKLGNSYTNTGTTASPSWDDVDLPDDLRPSVTPVSFDLIDNNSAASGNAQLHAIIDIRNIDSVAHFTADYQGFPQLWSSSSGVDFIAPATSFIQKTITLTDDNSAASNGTAVYLHLLDGNRAVLKSVCANNANSYFASDTDDRWNILDDDAAATGGYQVYVDEDADDGMRLIANLPREVVIYDQTGARALLVAADSSASSNGVALYFDDDGGTDTARLLFVSPTNASGSNVTVSPYTGQYGYELRGLFIPLYFDEDATAGSRLLHESSAYPKDMYIPAVNGDNYFFKVTYSATASTDGVAMYVDTGNTAVQRIEFVSPTNANGTETTCSSIRPFQVIQSA